MHLFKSQERIRVEERFRQGSPGQLVTASEMETIVGKPCQDSSCEGWKVVQRAIPYIEKHYNLFWHWDRHGKCWRCLTDQEKPAVVRWRLDKAKRNSRRAVRVGQSVDYSALPPEERTKATAGLVVAMAISRIASPFTRKRVEKIDHHAPDEEVLFQAFRRRLPK